MQGIPSAMEAASVPRVTFNYRDSGAPADFKEAMALFDCDGSGFVDKQKLVNAANSQKKLKGQNAVLTKVVGTLVVLGTVRNRKSGWMLSRRWH